MRTLVLLSAAIAAIAGAPTRSSVGVHASAYGKILFDGKGFALYAFTKDPKGRSTCSGPCASAWPPFVVPKRATAGAAVSDSLLGVTRRTDGRFQVTYAGRPLYYYVGDRKPGQVLCQNVPEFGGIWRVVRASGALVR
jgi:predicted lipoprotein with Yx(FWY)xxD motif